MSNLKLTIDLLPKGAWGSNLSSILPKKDWDKIRNFVYQKAGNKCEICGASGDLDAHEEWNFDIKSKTQTLKNIIALCSACHGVKHFRKSTRIGYGESVKAHFLKINKCSPMAFASHYAEAQFLFEERNEILRWKLKVNLDRFGGKDVEVTGRNVPFIENPYEDVDWTVVNHIRVDGGKLSPSLFSEPEGEKQIKLLLTGAEKNRIESLNKDQRPMYFSIEKISSEIPTSCPRPPKIDSIDVNNYEGSITVVSAYTNKIEWMSGDGVLKTKYNIGGKFTTKFKVEDLEDSLISFRLTGSFGETCSQAFELYSIPQA